MPADNHTKTLRSYLPARGFNYLSVPRGGSFLYHAEESQKFLTAMKEYAASQRKEFNNLFVDWLLGETFGFAVKYLHLLPNCAPISFWNLVRAEMLWSRTLPPRGFIWLICQLKDARENYLVSLSQEAVIRSYRTDRDGHCARRIDEWDSVFQAKMWNEQMKASQWASDLLMDEHVFETHFGDKDAQDESIGAGELGIEENGDENGGEEGYLDKNASENAMIDAFTVGAATETDERQPEAHGKASTTKAAARMSPQGMDATLEDILAKGEFEYGEMEIETDFE